MHRGAALALCVGLIAVGSASAEEKSYPFIGSWIRSDRACATSPTRERVYTSREVLSTRSRCTVRRIASGSGGFELFQRCERPNEKPVNVSEIIRMTGPDSMVLTRQTSRLKLSRTLHFTRCPGPPPGAPGKPGPAKG